MSPRKTFFTVAAVIGAIILMMAAGRMMETVQVGYYHVIQTMYFGNIHVKSLPGTYLQAGADVYVYPNEETFFATTEKDADDDIQGADGFAVEFADASQCTISMTARIRLPSNDIDRKSLLEKSYLNYRTIEQKLVKPTVRAALVLTANMMTAQQSYDEMRQDFFFWAKDQIENAPYQTETEDRVIVDPITGKETTKKFRIISRDEFGKPLRQMNPLKGTGIEITNFEIKKFAYEGRVLGQISRQQEARMAVEQAKADTEKAKQEEERAEADGKKAVTIARYQEEEIKIKAVTQAQRDSAVALITANQELGVAVLATKSAEQTKLKEILLGQGESERKKLNLAADGALAVKGELYKYGIDRMANAYANRAVPSTYFAGGGGGGPDNEFAIFQKMVNLQMIETLGLDLTMPKGKQTARK